MSVFNSVNVNFYFFLLLLLVSCLLHSLCQKVASDGRVDNEIHLEMTDDELHWIFGSKDNVPNYEVIQLEDHGRFKRSYLTDNSIDQPETEKTVGVPLKDKHLLLQLTQNNQLMTSPLRFEEIEDEGFSKVKYIVDHPQCLYHGKIAGIDGSSAAISTCGLRQGEMMGVVQLTASQPYMIRPIPKRLLKQDQTAHIVYSPDNQQMNHPCPHSQIVANAAPDDEIYQQQAGSRRRKRAAVEQNANKTIETAVFVDDVLYNKLLIENPKNLNEAVVNIVFTFINAVQLIYSQSSLTSHINIVLVQVSVIKRASAGPSKRQGNIENYLESFCTWQTRRNPKGDQNASHWDHALMLTGMDLYMSEPENTVVIGLAWVSGMCRRQFSCSLNEGTTFESVFVISHELGHNLGMQHDGEKNKNDCSETDFIMSSSLGPGKTTWSKCSNQYLKDFFKSSSSTCLNDKTNAKAELDYRSEYLPGQLYTAAVQCRYSYGNKYKPYVTDDNPFNNVCRELWCANGTVARRAHPALDGTPCGNTTLQQCFHGKCVDKQQIRQELQAYNLLPPVVRHKPR